MPMVMKITVGIVAPIENKKDVKNYLWDTCHI